MTDGLDRKVDVECRPVQMIGGEPLYLPDVIDRSTPKPWKRGKRKEQFLAIEQQPETVH